MGTTKGKVEQAESDLVAIVARKEAETAEPTPAPLPAGPAIFRAMPAIMKEVGHIEKSRQNPQQGYKFRGIDEVYEAVQLVLAKHGVCVIPFVQQQSREERATKSGGGVLTYTILTVDHTFYAEDGSRVVARTVGEAMDSGDKSSNKAMSAAMKYALLESLCIPTREAKDTEEESPEPAPRQQPAQPMSKTAPSQAQPSASRCEVVDKTETTRCVRDAGHAGPHSYPAGERKRPWMGRLQAAVAKLGLGDSQADAEGMKGKKRDDFVRDCRIAYLRWCAGRDAITSTLDLTDGEADVVIRRAELGEVPA